MRIIFIVTHLIGGGAERETVVFANELVNIGEEVHIICIQNLKDDYVVDERVHRHLFHGTRISIPKIKGACNQILMTSLLHKIHGDVVFPIYVPFHLAVLFSGARLVYPIRGNLDKELLNISDKIKNKFASQFAHGIWIQTEGQRQYFPKRIQRKLFEVHNILDPRFLQIRRQPLGQITRFISVGRLHPQKNQKMLIEAFNKMIQRTGNDLSTLTIYGRVRKDFVWVEEELKRQIEELGLKNRVSLAGWAEDIEERYKEADVFVFSSDYEGCPNALMEAMAAGLPCISTDCPTGPSMLIESGKNGLLVPVGDAEAMSQAMEYLIDHPKEADRLGREAKQRMREWGTAREQAESLMENLRKICS